MAGTARTSCGAGARWPRPASPSTGRSIVVASATMSALVGVEFVQHFPHARAAGFDIDDLTYVDNVAIGLVATLNIDGGHPTAFVRSDQDVDESHVRDASQGGQDGQFADRV